MYILKVENHFSVRLAHTRLCSQPVYSRLVINTNWHILINSISIFFLRQNSHNDGSFNPVNSHLFINFKDVDQLTGEDLNPLSISLPTIDENDTALRNPDRYLFIYLNF